MTWTRVHVGALALLVFTGVTAGMKQKDGFSTFKSNISAFFKKSSAGQSSNIPKYPAAASDEVISETRSDVHKQAAAEGGCRQSFLRKLLM